MSNRIDEIKKALPTPSSRVAGKIIDDGKKTVTVRMAEFLLEIPQDAILEKEDLSDGVTIFNLQPDADILMTSVLPVEDMIGALSSRIIEDSINPDYECCECVGGECSECMCPHCAYCPDDIVFASKRRLPVRPSRFRRIKN
jgi:hypothetical protein